MHGTRDQKGVPVTETALRMAVGSFVAALALSACGGDGEEASPGQEAYDEAFAECMQDERRAYWYDRTQTQAGDESLPGNKTIEEALETEEIESQPNGSAIVDEMEERCDPVAEEAKADVERGEPESE